MKGQLLSTAIAAGLLFSVGTAAEAATPPHNGAQPLNRFTVELRPRVDTRLVVATLESHGVSVQRVIKDDAGDVLAVSIDLDNPPDMNRLKSLAPYVRSYGIDVARRPMALDEPIPDIPSGNETIPWGITAVGAQDVAFGGGRKVCIIDTGYDLGNSDLQTTRVDGVDRGAGAWSQDGHGHGTHVAGTIAALGGNDQGVVGVIPGGDADLFIVRAFTDEGGWSYASDLTGAMLDCADAGANVISMSLGGDFPSPLEERTATKLQRQGILVIAAAGNGTSPAEAQGQGPSWFNSFQYPASYASVVSVAALDRSLERAEFSQRNHQVTLTGPGVDVLSTATGGGTTRMSGTSMATPHVAGVAALVWSNYKSCSATEIVDALKKSTLDLGGAGYDVDYGWGLVQAPGAMEYLAANPCSGRR